MSNCKYTADSVKSILESEGYRLIGKYEKFDKQIVVRCPQGHTYPVYLGNFNRGNRCGYCKGNKRLTFETVKEFIESKGYTLLSQRYSRAHDPLTMQCPSGHHYIASFNSFKRGVRCSQCSSSKGEHLIRELLKHFLIDTEFKEQYRIDKDGNKYYYDFCIESNPKIFIEYDGIQHFKPRDFFGGEEGLKATKKRDEEKTTLIESIGGLLIRVPYYLDSISVYNLLKEKLAPLVDIDSKWEFNIKEYNPKGYDYVKIAEYFKGHSYKETAAKFNVSLSFPSSCFIKVYGKPKKVYLKEENK
ncbi:homing endonuclease [Bacillus phage BvP]